MLTMITARIKCEPVMYYLFNKRNGETVTQNIYKSNCFNLSETLRKLTSSSLSVKTRTSTLDTIYSFTRPCARSSSGFHLSNLLSSFPNNSFLKNNVLKAGTGWKPRASANEYNKGLSCCFCADRISMLCKSLLIISLLN